MRKVSAGLLIYRLAGEQLQVFLVHPGGPFWAKKDEHAWSIPKGEPDALEDIFAAALREFTEETGLAAPKGSFVALTPLKQHSGKVLHAWAIEGDYDASSIASNAFAMEWPPHSGKMQEFPEVDRAAWFPLDVANQKIHKGQVGFLDELRHLIGKERGQSFAP